MKTLICRAMIAVLFGFSSSVALATTFEIVYEQDEPNTGYFDLTPVDPIDGIRRLLAAVKCSMFLSMALSYLVGFFGFPTRWYCLLQQV
jgi:hypothetical protein